LFELLALCHPKVPKVPSDATTSVLRPFGRLTVAGASIGTSKRRSTKPVGPSAHQGGIVLGDDHIRALMRRLANPENIAIDKIGVCSGGNLFLCELITFVFLLSNCGGVLLA